MHSTDCVGTACAQRCDQQNDAFQFLDDVWQQSTVSVYKFWIWLSISVELKWLRAFISFSRSLRSKEGRLKLRQSPSVCGSQPDLL